MPTSVGGANTHASPGWYLRAAAASCVATLIAMRAAHIGVGLTTVEVTVDSDSNDYGILGISDDVVAGPISVRVAASITGSTDGATLQDVVDWAVSHCPVTDAIRRAVPLSVEIDA